MRIGDWPNPQSGPISNQFIYLIKKLFFIYLFIILFMHKYFIKNIQ